jgi:hypothetical protein
VNCRVCDCSDFEPCLLDDDGVRFIDDDTRTDDEIERLELTPCSWIEFDLCSACVQGPAPALLVDQYGNPLRGAP